MVCNKKILLTSAICVFVGVGALVNIATASAQPLGGSVAAASEIRFQQLEKEIRKLTGRVEEQSYEIRSLKAELAKLTGDLEFRVNALEGGALVGGLGADNIAVNNQSRVKTLGTVSKDESGHSLPVNDPALKSYENAYLFIKNGDFASAESGFAKFIANYPDNKLVPNAKYWYGETFYVRGMYEDAARAFAEGYKNYPDSQKAASNLLKLGMSLKGMGKNDDACVAYKQLKKDYPRSSSPVMKRANTEMKRINCK